MTIDSNFVYFCIFIALPLARQSEFFPIVSFFFFSRKSCISFLRWVQDVVFLRTFPIVALRKIHRVQGENGGHKSTQQKSATISRWNNLSKFNEIMNHSAHTQKHKVRKRGESFKKKTLYFSLAKENETSHVNHKKSYFSSRFPFVSTSSMFSRYGSCSRLLNQKKNCLYEVTTKQKRGKVIHQRKKKEMSASEWSGKSKTCSRSFEDMTAQTFH